MDDQKIAEILSVANSYLLQIRELEIEFSKGVKQVNETADTAEAIVERRLATLHEHFGALLNERKKVLMTKILRVSFIN